MIKKRNILLFIFFTLIFSNLFLFAEKFPAADSDIKVCILAYNTEFKKNLTAALVKYFNSKGISVTVDTFTNGSQYHAADYDAVILLSGAFMFKPRSKAVKFIKENNYSSNIIYVFTTRKSYSPYGKVLDRNKIDAITSASITENDKAFDEVKNKIIEKVLKVLNK